MHAMMLRKLTQYLVVRSMLPGAINFDESGSNFGSLFILYYKYTWNGHAIVLKALYTNSTFKFATLKNVRRSPSLQRFKFCAMDTVATIATLLFYIHGKIRSDLIYAPF